MRTAAHEGALDCLRPRRLTSRLTGGLHIDYLTALAEAVRAELPPEHRDGDSGLFLLYALLARTKGEATTAADVHDAWAAWKAIGGDAHESLVPFSDLSAEVQDRDLPFLRAIHAVSRQI